MSRINIDQLWSSATAIIFGRKTTGAGQGEELSATEVRTLINVADGANVGLPLTGGALSGALNEAKGTDIASATTCDIGAATGNYVVVTGTTTITGLGTVQAGTRRIVNFSGALILTHHATSLILPTGANITTVAGDTAIFISLGSGNWVCTSYQRKDGTALVSAGGGGFDPTTTVEIMEDFVGGTYTTNNIGNYGWRQGGLGNALDAVATAGIIGIVHISTDGANANRGTWINLNQISTKGILLGTQGNCTSIFSVRNAQAVHADVTLRAGLVSQGVVDNDDAVDGIYFRSIGLGNWYAVTRKASTETTTDTGITQSTSFLQFKIVSSSDGANIYFYIGGVLKATHTTNIPIVAIGPFFQITSASTTAYSLDADYFYLKVTGLTR